jgi:hypothetical protein
MKLIEYLQVLNQFIYSLKCIRPHFFGADIFKGYFSLFGIVPEIGLMSNHLLIIYLYYFTIVVKDTA